MPPVNLAQCALVPSISRESRDWFMEPKPSSHSNWV
ncbi:hypothetical protein SLEP1_g11444 [Rubroshorea leprosula]|uniref:Uncharacterized protein n=1 Tax=Rubroshorea leprosula TaxID=152421 RepID=A0AAV5IJA6_9ROSI|nr:hypothetical protein SLEP1_g11444 [Rubroshorea leprosula]